MTFLTSWGVHRCRVPLPFLVILTKKGFEVPHVLDLVDECAVQLLQEFDGKKLICHERKVG